MLVLRLEQELPAFYFSATVWHTRQQTAIRNVNGAGEQETNQLHSISVGIWNNFSCSDSPSNVAMSHILHPPPTSRFFKPCSFRGFLENQAHKILLEI
jgi:hypothetical protein